MERTALSILALTIAYVLDHLIGDPSRFPHPVRILGAVIDLLENAARRLFISPGGLKFSGFLIVVIAAGGSVFLTIILLTAAYRLNMAAGLLLELYIFFTVLAGGDLRNHVMKVGHYLKAGRLEKARSSVALLVSRDTGSLNENGVSRAALESLFENSSDGLVGPLFFAALGGAPLAVFYKAVNTLDSMLGYKSNEYLNLGCFAARIDDLLSFIPARLTALFLILAGSGQGGFRRGLQALHADRHKHQSPNSAWPEAAAAGVLDIRFGGADFHQGKLREQPVINAQGKESEQKDIWRALDLFWRMSLLAFICLLLISYWFRAWGLNYF